MIYLAGPIGGKPHSADATFYFSAPVVQKIWAEEQQRASFQKQATRARHLTNEC